MFIKSVFQVFFMFIALGANALVCASDAVSAQQILNTLGNKQQVAGEFVQERHLSVLETPLVSKGGFSLSSSGMLEWRVTQPFSVSYVFENSSLKTCMSSSPFSEKAEPTIQCKTVKKTDDPMLYGFFEFFSGVFSSSEKDLSDWFDVSLNSGSTEYSGLLSFNPKKNFLKKNIAFIELHYESSNVQQVSIVEPVQNDGSQDKQVLLFSY